jgi:hypothetical protein
MPPTNPPFTAVDPVFFQPLLNSNCARNGYLVSPSDSADLPRLAARGLYVVAAGTLTVDFIESGKNISLGTLPAGAVGTIVPLGVRRVRSTGTSATVIALF